MTPLDPIQKKELRRNITTISERRKQRLENVLRMRQTDFTIILENIWDPHNVSAILRSADAVGIDTVHLLYYIEKFPDLKKSGKQSSASARKWLSFQKHTSVNECFTELKSKGFKILSSHLTTYSSSLFEIDFTGKIAVVVGNEHRGVSEEACTQSDGVFYIPMFGMVQSLNASVAAAVSLYEACRQRMQAGSYDKPAFSEETIRTLLPVWAKK